jgi:hypothetical protein
LGVASTFTYYATRYKKDLRLVDSGSDIFWQILRFAVLNDVHELREHAVNKFNEVIETACYKGDEFPEAEEWLKYRLADALAPNPPFPPVPMELLDAILGEGDTARR